MQGNVSLKCPLEMSLGSHFIPPVLDEQLIAWMENLNLSTAFCQDQEMI